MNTVRKLNAASWLLLAIGLALNIKGQIAGTRGHAPDPTERMIWAIVPFAVLAFALWRLVRTKGQAILVVIVAALVALMSTTYENDEMRLTYVLAPLMQLLLILVMVGALTADRWRLRRREHRAAARV